MRYPKHPLLGSLPPGKGVVQASAGTGKTYLLERMVVDFILQGVPLEKILLVTYTDKAALELKTRIRQILETLVSLEVPAHPVPDPAWDLGPDELALLGQALRSFDRASHSTIHSFCQRVLVDGAFEGGALLRQELADGKTLFDRAFRELLRTRFKGAPEAAQLFAEVLRGGWSVERLQGILEAAHGDRAQLLPEAFDLAPILARFQPAWLEAPASLETAFRAARVDGRKITPAMVRLPAFVELMASRPTPFAFLKGWDSEYLMTCCEKLTEGPGHDLGLWLQETQGGRIPAELLVVRLLLPPIQRRVAELKAAEGLYDYDDIILQTLQALQAPSGAGLVERVREKFSIAIIDEFQDTDQDQWKIFETLFNQDSHRLFVIGDPKQAIYGFRGGDLPTYHQAVKAILGAEAPRNLTENYRSTPAMIEAYNLLFTGGTGPEDWFFRDRTVYPLEAVVRAGNPNLEATTHAGAPLAPVTLLCIPRAAGGEHTRRQVAAILAREIKDLVQAGVVLTDTRKGLATVLGYGDVRVLVGTGNEGRLVARALARLGVPCVAFKQRGLFQTDEAKDLRDVLRAVEQPRDPGCRGRAMLTPFFGYRLADLEGLSAMPEDHPVLQRLQDWRKLGQERQFSQLLEAMLRDSGLIERLRLQSGNERALTNYLHLAELLAGTTGAFDLAAMTRQLHRWIEGQEQPAGEDPELQRLEGQDDAVQVMTLHASKGLEGGIVAVFAHSEGRKNVLHRFYQDGRRCATFGAGAALYEKEIELETNAEEERLMYVALTRAKAHLILPCYLEETKKGEPIHPKSDYRVVNRRIRALATVDPSHPELFCRKEVGLGGGPGTRTQAVDLSGWTLPELKPAPVFPYEQARQGARPTFNASYSSIMTRLKHLARRADSPPVELETEPAELPAKAEGLPRGPQTGQSIHELLEVEDTAQAMALDFRPWWQEPARRSRVRALLAEHDLAPRWDEPAAQMVHAALRVPLPDRAGPGAPLGVHDHLLREMGFQARFLDTGDFLNGSMDAVYERDGLAWFLDWKTDTLAAFDEDTMAAHVEEHFTVQCRIYTRVLLDWLGILDEAGYERRFGGIHYVFLRGGPAVLTFRPSWAEVQAWEPYFRELHEKVAHA